MFCLPVRPTCLSCWKPLLRCSRTVWPTTRRSSSRCCSKSAAVSAPRARASHTCNCTRLRLPLPLLTARADRLVPQRARSPLACSPRARPVPSRLALPLFPLRRPDLKSLRSQVESYLALNYEVALISLFITEAVGKAVGVLLPQKEKRKLYFSSLLSTYSVCRANSWMLLRANHSIDIGKTGSKLNVQVAAPVRRETSTRAAVRALMLPGNGQLPPASPWTRRSLCCSLALSFCFLFLFFSPPRLPRAAARSPPTRTLRSLACLRWAQPT